MSDFASGISMLFRGTDRVVIHDNDSYRLRYVAEQIAELRARGGRSGSGYSARRREIENDPNLSEQGKRTELSALEEAHRASQRALRDRELEIIDNTIRDLESSIDGLITTSSTDLIAARDAFDRAEALSDRGQALTVLDRAIRTRDTVLANAIFRRALEANWEDVADLFTRERPEIAQAARDIRKLHALRNEFGRGLYYA